MAHISLFTCGCVAVIILAAVIGYFTINYWKDNDKLLANRKIVEFIPTLVSTLGVFGTFLGITVGLMAFDTTNLNESIPVLLDGLKTAFWTSLVGMGLSAILNGWINRLYDKKENGVSDINQAASQICNSVTEMSKNNAATIDRLTKLMDDQAKTQTAFYNSMGQLMSTIAEQMVAIPQMQESISSMAANTSTLSVLARSQETSMKAINESMDNALLETRSNGSLLEKMNASLSTELKATNTALSSVDNNMSEMLEASTSLYSFAVFRAL